MSFPHQFASCVAKRFITFCLAPHEEGWYSWSRTGGVWVTGLPGSRESTIAHVLLDRLSENKIHTQIVPSDMLRKVITPNPTYTEDERDIVCGAIVFVIRLLTGNGVNVIMDATGNRRKYRDNARKEIAQFPASAFHIRNTETRRLPSTQTR